MKLIRRLARLKNPPPVPTLEQRGHLSDTQTLCLRTLDELEREVRNARVSSRASVRLHVAPDDKAG